MVYYLYIDESGELGTHSNSSQYFVIAALCTPSPSALTKRMKKNVATLINKGWPKEIEVKGYNVWNCQHNKSIPSHFDDQREQIINNILRDVLGGDAKIIYSVAKKSNLKKHLLEAPYGIAYNFLTAKLLTRSFSKFFPKQAIITVDRRSKETHDKSKFDGHIETQLLAESDPPHPGPITILHEDSERVHGLLAVDFVSWALFRHYEFDDSRFMEILKPKIGFRDPWYPEK